MSLAAAEGGGPSLGGEMLGPGRLAPALGTRDLFPLPHVEPPKRPHGGGSLKRWRERRRRADLVNDAVDAVNWMAGRPLRGGEAAAVDEMQLAVIARFDGLAKRAMQPDSGVGKRSARQDFCDLLRGRAVYGGGAS